jgi:hypothetical protein
MEIVLSKAAIKFLEKNSAKEVERIREKLSDDDSKITQVRSHAFKSI